MAVDHEARNDLRSALVRYMTGAIRSLDFDDLISGYFNERSTPDHSVRQIARSLSYTYDDFVDHSISVNPEGWTVLRRVIAFLSTNLEMTASPEPDAWPFCDKNEWLQNARLLDEVEVPQYDPAIHRRDSHPWCRGISPSVVVPLVGGIIGIVVFVLLLVLR